MSRREQSEMMTPRFMTMLGATMLALTGFASSGMAVSGSKPEALTLIPPAGVYSSNVVVRHEAPPGVVRYTLDGSEPGPQSPALTNALTLTKCTTVRARLFVPGQAAGEIVTQSYYVLDEELKDFTSNLPLVMMATSGEEFTQENKLTVALHAIPAGTNRASLRGDPDYSGRAVAAVRGRSSRRAPKHSFSVKLLEDGSDEKRKASLLGMPRESDWVLYAPWADKSLIRDVLSYELGNEMGRYAPRTRFVEVFLVEQGTCIRRSDYFGVYALVERITRDKFRLNLDKMEEDDKSEPDITGGYIFKKDHYARDEMPRGRRQHEEHDTLSALADDAEMLFQAGGFPVDPKSVTTPDGTVLPVRTNASPLVALLAAAGPMTNRVGALSMRDNGSAGSRVMRDSAAQPGPDSFATRLAGNEFFFVHPEPDEITGAQRAWLRGYLNRLEQVLYGPDFRNPLVGYAAYLDAGSFIDYHLLTEVTKNVDGFRFSTYYHKDRNGLLRMGPLWDMNLTFGNASGKEGYLPERWLWPQLDEQEYSWFRRLFEDPDFGQSYVDRWSELRTNVFATARVLTRVDAMAAQLEEAQKRNFARWPILGDRVVPNYFVGDTYAQEIKYVKDWTTARLAWIEQQFLPVPSARLQTSTNAAQRTATLSIARTNTPGQILYTLDGSDPRAAGGSLLPAAKTAAAPVACASGERLFARFKQGNRWSGPMVLAVP